MKVVIVAVSGGVDSVALLHMMVRSSVYRPIVVHVDHGIRPDSAADARFVAALAKSYKVPYYIERVELGPEASEEAARRARYAILQRYAARYSASIATAHHKNDVVETITINCVRGTGWRGLAVLSREDSIRPLLYMTKAQLYEYAQKHALEWVEDETNEGARYLRNRIRPLCLSDSVDHDALLALRSSQIAVRRHIEKELKRIAVLWSGRKYPYCMVDRRIASEVMRVWVFLECDVWLDRIQVLHAVDMVRVASRGASIDVGGGIKINILSDKFIVDTV